MAGEHRPFRVRDRHDDPHRARLVLEPTFEAAAIAYAEHLPFVVDQHELRLVVHDVESGREHSYTIHFDHGEPASIG